MTLDLRTLFRLACPSGTRTLYVSGTGNDGNSGLSSGLALRQITTAVAMCQPGDRIVVGSGTYASFSLYNVKGTASAWVTVEGPADDTAVVDGTNGNDGAAAVDMQLSCYIGIYGLNVAGSQSMTPVSISGIAVFRGSHHIRVWNNHVHDFPSGGVNCFYIQSSLFNGQTLPAGGWDVVDVAFNKIHGCCKYDPNNASGVSMFGAEDITGLTWDGRYGYMVRGNYVYDCECTMPYTAGGFNFVTDGNGISLDSLNTATVFNSGNAPYVKRGLNEGNVVVGCGGRGLHIYNTINVDDFFNTYVGNLRTVSQAITNGVETDASYDTVPGSPGVVHYGNVICPLNTPNTTDTVSTYTSNVILGGTQAVPGGNTDRRGIGVRYFAGAPTAAALLAGLGIAAFIPSTRDAVNRAAYWSGYQALGYGPRDPAQWAAGGVETIPRRYVFKAS